MHSYTQTCVYVGTIDMVDLESYQKEKIIDTEKMKEEKKKT